jgi:hypothetical protein
MQNQKKFNKKLMNRPKIIKDKINEIQFIIDMLLTRYLSLVFDGLENGKNTWKIE